MSVEASARRGQAVKFGASLLFGVAAYWLAIGAGVDPWRDGWDVGDAADIGALVFLASWMMSVAREASADTGRRDRSSATDPGGTKNPISEPPVE